MVDRQAPLVDLHQDKGRAGNLLFYAEAAGGAADKNGFTGPELTLQGDNQGGIQDSPEHLADIGGIFFFTGCNQRFCLLHGTSLNN